MCPLVLIVNCRGVRKWWAEYLESMGELEQAMQFYETANDYYSLVRILCFSGQIARAIEIAEESGCKAAAYHLAKRLSMENGVREEGKGRGREGEREGERERGEGSKYKR